MTQQKFGKSLNFSSSLNRNDIFEYFSFSVEESALEMNVPPVLQSRMQPMTNGKVLCSKATDIRHSK